MPRSAPIASTSFVQPLASGTASQAMEAASTPVMSQAATVRADAVRQYHTPSGGIAHRKPNKALVPESRFAMIGIVGGMGPAAGIDTAAKLVAYAQSDEGKKAKLDQDVPAFDLQSISTIISDRTKFLLAHVVDKAGATPKTEAEKAQILLSDLPDNPYPGIQQSVDNLQHSGARVVVMPCNTAHAWYDSLKVKPGVQIVHIVDSVIAALDKDPKLSKLPIKKIGLLATSGTIACGIYQARLEKLGRTDVKFVFPDAQVQQDLVNGGIYGLDGDPGKGGIKGGQWDIGRERLLKAGSHLVSKGVDVLSYSCTEIPLVLGEKEKAFDGKPGIDATKAMVVRAVDTAEQLIVSERAAAVAAAAAKAASAAKPVSTMNNRVRPFGMA